MSDALDDEARCGVYILAALRAAGGSASRRRVVGGAAFVVPPLSDGRPWGRAVWHARASGLIVEHYGDDTWSLGPRHAAIATDANNETEAREAMERWDAVMGAR